MRVTTLSPRPQATDTAGTGDTVYCAPPLFGELWRLAACYFIPEQAVTAHASNYATYEVFGSDGVECGNFDGDTPTTDDLVAGTPKILAMTIEGTARQYQPSSLGAKCTITKASSGVATTGQFAAVWEHLRDVD